MKKWQNKESSVMQHDVTDRNNSTSRNTVVLAKNNKKRAAPKANTVCVLIIMTDKELAERLEKFLSEHFHISILEDSTQVTKTCVSQKPKAIIVDEFVDGVYGYNICSQIKMNKETEDIPVIALVKLDDMENLLLYTNSGAVQLFPQTISPNMLIANINIAIKNVAENKKYNKKILADIISTTVPGIPGKNKNEQALMERIHTFLEKNITSKYTVTILSKDMGMCRSNLYIRMEEITHTSPKHYIDSYKLKKAEQMLLSQKYNIAEIADYLGYCDSKYFGKKFKAAYHVSPKKYLEQKLK